MRQLRFKDNNSGKTYRVRGRPQKYMFLEDLVRRASKSDLTGMLADDYIVNLKKYSLEDAVFLLNFTFFQIEELYKIRKYNVNVIRRCINRDYPNMYIYQDFDKFSQAFSLVCFENIDAAVRWMHEQRKLDYKKSTRTLAKSCLLLGYIKNNLNYSPHKLENYYAQKQSSLS